MSTLPEQPLDVKPPIEFGWQIDIAAPALPEQSVDVKPPKPHRRLLLPEKPLYSWTLVLAKAGKRGSAFLSAKMAYVVDAANDLTDMPLIFLVMLPYFLVIMAVVLVAVLATLGVFGIGLFLWLAFLPFGIVMSFAGGLLAVIGAANRWSRRRRGLTLRCKRGRCKFRDVQLAYRCPRCGQGYCELFPSYFGLFYHHCTCGERIPVLARLGREELTKVCPVCKTVWCHGEEPVIERFIGLVGGGSVGKTSYLAMAVQALLDGGNRDLPVRASFESRSDELEHSERLGALSAGCRLPATQRGIPDALVLRLQRDPRQDERLYLYDASGEEYIGLERESGAEMTFFQDVSGILLMVDPLGLARSHLPVSEGVSEDDPSGASLIPLRLVVGTLCRNVRRFLRYGYGGLTEIPLAVVITKADCPEVAGRIGAGANRPQDADHDACRRALIEWGAGDQVVAIERDFAAVRYFSCSALGRTPDHTGKPFVAWNVLPPLLWLLELQLSQRRVW